MFQPEIIHKNHTQVSPWMSLVEKEVKLAPGSMNETYHCITQDAYVGVMAQLEDGRIAIIKQYRPCVETFTWEFVGGTLDASETPLQAAARELAEEAGLHSDELTLAGEYFPDTGRLDLPSFGVFAGKCVSLKDWIPEPGVDSVICHPCTAERNDYQRPI